MKRKKNEQNIFIKSSIAIFAILLVLALAVAGCSKAPTSADKETLNPGTIDDDSAGEDIEDDAQTPIDTTPVITKDETVIAADNKSETQKTQEQIDQAIADGTYTGTATYTSPGGLDEIEITLTVEKDIVQDVSITTIKADRTSQKYINGVAAALPDLVIGKKITELNLPTQISGSSLTVAAFNKDVEALIAKY